MKGSGFHLSNVSYLAAFVIGVILFAMFWKNMFGVVSGTMLLVGMAGVAIAVTVFRVRHEVRSRKK